MRGRKEAENDDYEVPADWYPDPSGNGMLRYWDGAGWTEHTVPPPPAMQAMPHTIVTKVPAHTSPTFHLLMTVFTCGLWLPIWVVYGLIKSLTHEKHVSKIY